MYPPKFSYVAPKDLRGALSAIGKPGFSGTVLAGGQSLIPMLKARSTRPTQLVDISRIKKLKGITKRGSVVEIGAAVTLAEALDSKILRGRAPMLIDAVGHIADPLVRNMGTIGGNLCNADPANDLPAVALAYRATMEACSVDGEREISADSFFVGPHKTSLRKGEMLRSIRIHIPPKRHRTGETYIKVKNGWKGYSLAAVACGVGLDPKGSVVYVGIALTSLAEFPKRAAAAEAELLGGKPSAAALARAAEAAAYTDASPADDTQGSAEYKREVARRLTLEALRRALAMATKNGGLYG